MTAIEPADQRAGARVAAVRPQWRALRRVYEVVPDSARRLFHAGPAYRSADEIPAPVRHSMCVAAVFERWCDDFAAAEQALRDGSLRHASAQDHGLVVPLAGVLSASMAVLEIADAAGGTALHAAINEGQSHATRLGLLDAALPAHLAWLHGEFADALGRLAPPLDLLPVMDRARALGDDGHARTVAGSRLLAAELLARAPWPPAARGFLDASPAFALSFWMGAAALAARAAEGEPDAALVTRAGGNGREFGIQLAGRPGEWVCIAAPRPVGPVDAAHAGSQAVGALGDSAVVDFFGLGGQALAHAPALRESLAAVLPEDALERPRRILTPLGEGALRPAATSARRCVQSGRGPLVLIGMIDAAGRAGRIGGGVVDVPPALFARALAHLGA